MPSLHFCAHPCWGPGRRKRNPLCGTALTARAPCLQKKNDLLYKTALRRKARRLAVKLWMLTWQQKDTEGNLECLYAALFRDSISEAVRARLPEGPVRKMLAPPLQVGDLAFAGDCGWKLHWQAAMPVCVTVAGHSRELCEQQAKGGSLSTGCRLHCCRWTSRDGLWQASRVDPSLVADCVLGSCTVAVQTAWVKPCCSMLGPLLQAITLGHLHVFHRCEQALLHKGDLMEVVVGVANCTNKGERSSTDC